MKLNNILTSALEYEKFGFSIIPIGIDKKPLVFWKEFQLRKASIEEITNWCFNSEITGIAVITGSFSNIFVVDIDEESASAGLEFPPTVSVLTGRGKHLYFRYPEAYRIQNSTNLLPHVDIRGEGGYAILPPSSHPSGKQYEWINDLSTPIAEAPEWLLKLIREKEINGNSGSLVPEIVQGVQEGGRNDSATRIIGTLLAHQPESHWNTTIWPLIQSWNQTNIPPLTESELVSVFKSIANRESSKRSSSSQSQNIYINDQVTDLKIESISLSELMDKQFSDDIWTVDHLILENGINCIAGRPKSGKSFVVLQMAKNVAEGSPVFGKYKTKKSNVLLITKEDSLRLLKKRLLGLGANNNLPIAFSIDASIYLDTDLYLNSIIHKCFDLNAKIVIFDSFRRFMHGDENNSADVTKLHWFFKQLNETGITVIFIHHFRKGKEISIDSIRGSSDITAMVDSAIILELDKTLNVIQITQNALREDEEEKPFSVSFPKFTDQNKEFKIADSNIQVQKSSEDQAINDVLDYLQKQKQPVYQQVIIKALVKENGPYQDTCVKNAIKRLARFGRIIPSKKGTKTYYRLPEQQSQGQTSNGNDEVTDGAV